MPWGPTEWDHTRHAMVTDVKGYECRMSPTLEYRTELRGHLDDKTTIRIASLDFDFLERVSDWVKEHYPNGELSGGFSRDRIRAVEYVDEGRYRYSLACSQNKKGIAAKRALWAEFFDESFHRKDMDADAEKQKILRDIEKGKAVAHKDAAATNKETNTMLIYRDPATGWLYRVSPEQEHGSYVMQYRDPANSATWKWCTNWNIGNIYRESLEEVLEARAKRDGWELVSGPNGSASSLPEICRGCLCWKCGNVDCDLICDHNDREVRECENLGSVSMGESCEDYIPKKEEYEPCQNQPAPNGDAAATTAGSAVPEPVETPTTPTDANTLPAPGCPADAGSATQSLSAAGPASLEAEPEATPFDYSGLDDQTVADLHLAEREYVGGKRMAEMGLRRMADGVAIAHEALCVTIATKCRNGDGAFTASENTFGRWCESIGLNRKAAERLLQVAKLMDGSSPREQKVLEELSPSLLYATAKPSAPAELVQAVKDGDITTHKQYQDALAEIRKRDAKIQELLEMSEVSDRRADEAQAWAKKVQHEAELDRKEREDAHSAAMHYKAECDRREREQQRIEGLLNTCEEELHQERQRVKALESRPVEVAVQEPDPAEVERRAGEKAREMTAMLQAQMRGMQEDLDDARKIIDSAESVTYMAAAEFAANATQALNGIRASFWAVAKELSDEDFSSAAAPLLEAARRIWDCEWDDDEDFEEEQE